MVGVDAWARECSREIDTVESGPKWRCAKKSSLWMMRPKKAGPVEGDEQLVKGLVEKRRVESNAGGRNDQGQEQERGQSLSW